MTIAVVAIALVLLAIALAGAGAPLLRTSLPPLEPPASPLRERRAALLRELDDLDAARGEGSLAPTRYTQLRAATERRLETIEDRLNGSRSAETSTSAARTSGRGGRATTAALITALAAVVVVPALLSAAGTRGIGQPITGTLPTVGPTTASSTSGGTASIAALRARVRTAPSDVGARMALARAEFDAGRLADASSQYLAVLRLDRTNAEATARLGLILGLSGRPAQGMRTIDHALSLDPGYHEAHFFRAVLELRMLGRPRAAARDARAFLEEAGPTTSAVERRGARRIIAAARSAGAVSGSRGSGT